MDKWFFITMAIIAVGVAFALSVKEYSEKQASTEYAKAGLQQCNERILDEDGDYLRSEILWKKECK